MAMLRREVATTAAQATAGEWPLDPRYHDDEAPHLPLRDLRGPPGVFSWIGTIT
ncbi:hypothetical protein [Rhodoplanes elegans]|uniref:hypothetical protein n=1 Tax=Rhodoplanes elegans TaxID=29408 RepID=UPI001475E111|nr:hypothetical protein [Rhodoplanes elegans]